MYSERLMFDWVVRFYLDLIIWTGQKRIIFEFTNVATTLVVLLLTIIFFFLSLALLSVGWVMFFN
jgi:hypothetical protein